MFDTQQRLIFGPHEAEQVVLASELTGETWEFFLNAMMEEQKIRRLNYAGVYDQLYQAYERIHANNPTT